MHNRVYLAPILKSKVALDKPLHGLGEKQLISRRHQTRMQRLQTGVFADRCTNPRTHVGKPGPGMPGAPQEGGCTELNVHKEFNQTNDL